MSSEESVWPRADSPLSLAKVQKRTLPEITRRWPASVVLVRPGTTGRTAASQGLRCGRSILDSLTKLITPISD